jgi:hypothetical protein
MLEALCRQSSTTLDVLHAEDGPPITQRTSGLARRTAGGILLSKKERIRRQWAIIAALEPDGHEAMAGDARRLIAEMHALLERMHDELGAGIPADRRADSVGSRLADGEVIRALRFVLSVCGIAVGRETLAIRPARRTPRKNPGAARTGATVEASH